MRIPYIWSNNQLFGRYLSWYRAKFCDYKYNLGQGEFLMGELEGLISTGGLAGILILLIDKYTGYLLPWYLVLVIAFGSKILKVFIGILDKRVLKIGQASNEYTVRKNLAPVSNEMLDRNKNIEKLNWAIIDLLIRALKVEPDKSKLPEAFKEKHKTYLE